MIFGTIIKLLLENKHKTSQGLQEILNYRGGLNWGLRASGIACAENFKIAFPLTQPISRTLFNKAAGKFSESLSPEWLAGFCTPSA